MSTNLDGTVTLWDVETATPRETLRGHWNSVQQPVFAPDGKTLYTVSHDGTAIAWDMTGKRGLGRTFTFTHDRPISAAGFDGHPGEFSPDGRLIAVGLKERGIALWDARELTTARCRPCSRPAARSSRLPSHRTGERLRRRRGDGARHALGRPFAIAARDELERRTDDAGLRRLQPGRSERSRRRASRGVMLWDAATGARLGQIGAGETARRPTFSADGRMIASARGWKGGADVWDVATRTSTATVDGLPYTADWTVALSPDGRTLAVGGWGTAVRVVDVRHREAPPRARPGRNRSASRSSSAPTAGSSRSPASRTLRPSGTSRAGPRSARGSRPAAAGRCSTSPPTGAAC